MTLSATDLSHFLGCRHRTALDLAVSAGARAKPVHYDDPLLEILWERGAKHEAAYIDSLKAQGLSIADLSAQQMNRTDHLAATLAAMRDGTDVVVQGALADGCWFGKPDVMRRVPRPSALGPWSYEIYDTKLARETRAGTILQLGLYSELLATAQGARPEWFYVVTPDETEPVQSYRVDDYAAYFRFVQARLLAAVATGHERLALDNYPEPVDHCDICHWIGDCKTRWRADDHLSLVANITRAQRREFETHGVTTTGALAALALPLAFKPKRGSVDGYVRAREQARVQVESRGKTPPLHELLAVEPERGLRRLPEPSAGDLFLDLEGDSFAVGAGEGGREYLFGVIDANGDYRSEWAFTDHAERAAFEGVIDRIVETARAHPGMHVYHYAPYEPSAFKRLMGRYATRESELDAMLRAGRFVDLYAVVKQGLRAGVERYSIKDLESLYGFTRAAALSDARRCRTVMECGLETGIPDSVPAAVRDVVEAYNRDDCLSTLRLRDWLERLRGELVAAGADVPRPLLADGEAPADVDERAQIVAELRARLLARVPEERLERREDQQGRWLLAYMLDYHRREDKVVWWEYFRMRELPEDELTDERDAVTGMQFVERVTVVLSKKGKPTGSVVDRYSYPPQEMEIERGDVRLQDGTSFGKVVRADRVRNTIDVRKGRAIADRHPSAMFAFSLIRSSAMEAALLRIGDRIASGEAGYDAARALLGAHAPRLATGAFAIAVGENEVDFAVRAVGALDRTMLAIQGPPGSGKTYCGARMICALVKAGKRVGVTGSSHRVIDNLLVEVATAARREGVTVRMAHKYGEDDESEDVTGIRCVVKNEEALAAIQSGAANVLGGTAWLWSREEFAGAVDVLFVDEAGQIALPNVVAVSQAASSVVLLGDPRQLEQPRKGTHPDGVGVSALEHLLGGHQTMPAERGLFLPVTRRLPPSICEFTSEVFYDGRLTTFAGGERQRIAGAAGLPAAGLALVVGDHDGNRHSSPEEVEVVADLVARLTGGGTWCDAAGAKHAIKGSDVLVVAPYNAHVNRLAERLAGTGVRVGTVDKFQGQEAPVVIYSMATSRPEDAPRGMEFLYSLNRLNVATSRARCVAVLVASRRLFEPECISPRQMKLANALCRFRELAARA